MTGKRFYCFTVLAFAGFGAASAVAGPESRAGAPAILGAIQTAAYQVLDETQMAEIVGSAAPDTMLTLINDIRSQNGLQTVRLESRLTSAADGHSEDMADNNFFSHTGSDGDTLRQRLAEVGYSYRVAAENIAAGYPTPEQVFQAWMNSSGHRANILRSDVREIGVGDAYEAASRYDYYWTLVLAAPR